MNIKRKITITIVQAIIIVSAYLCGFLSNHILKEYCGELPAIMIGLAIPLACQIKLLQYENKHCKE